MELTPEYTFQYLKDHPGASYDEIKKKYNELQQGASHLRSEVEKQGFNRSYAVLKNAFKNTLIKPREDYVDVFFRHLEQCASIWTPQQFYAPYTSLIQASGTGKSRLLRELAFEKDVFVIAIRLCQKTYLNMLGIGRTHLENIRNHLATYGIIPRVHGNIKRIPR
ncbi:hypothetical protein G9A89_009069 [Geosiphon pyriformis]|nr:hypothetical protein G9A89_009069 [Geosiphon pyriformis]